MRTIANVIKENDGDDLICLIENEWMELTREQQIDMINHDNREISDCAMRKENFHLGD